MRINIQYLAIIAGVSLMAAAPSGATAVTYTLTGAFDITLAGIDYDDISLTLTGIGDPDDAAPGPVRYIPLSSLTASVAGFGVFPGPANIQFFYGPQNAAGEPIAGFFDATTNTNLLVFSSPIFANFDGTSPVPPTPVDFEYANGVETAFGSFTMRAASNLTFATALAGAVPDSGTWAMFIGGFGLVGGAMRTRKRVAVSFG